MSGATGNNKNNKRLNLDRCTNFMRQFRDPDSRELTKLSANQFMDVWSHYDKDGKSFAAVVVPKLYKKTKQNRYNGRRRRPLARPPNLKTAAGDFFGRRHL